MSTSEEASASEDLRLPYRLRKHQAEALDALEATLVAGRRRAWVVLPPGAGKTLVGLETARRLGQRTVVFGPNTAIQTQWARGWAELLPSADHPAAAATGRELEAFFTALTYQSLATFLPDEEVDEEGEQHSLLARLHPHGRELVERLRALPRVTIVLDECHHLLEVWGRLLQVVLDELPDAVVLGLTATPPETLTASQRELVDELFGGVVYEASIPAVVREGHLAPFAELAWLVTPTPQEADYITGQAERFAELVHGLTDPAFGTVGFLEWVDRRFVRAAGDAVSWHRLVEELPELTDAALRLHHHGLVALPEGARLLEQHRRAPTAEDWVVLVDDWARHHLLRTDDPRDREVVEVVRRALPSVGYRWTRRGIRRGRSPVDRVLARSEAKTRALVEIVGIEQRNLGERLRMLVLCDHERAAAALPVDLHGVMEPEAGSAMLALEQLLADPGTRLLDPLLVTGSQVRAAPATLERLVSRIARDSPELAGRLVVDTDDGRSATLAGPWDSRDWVPWVTRFLDEGGTQVLVGTRGLLGEGWDAPAVTGLVDLTAATTSTAVVQTRGRALRTDAGWPEKVALTWTVVCVTDDHPKGNADWTRFVRKHEGFYGVDEEGDVVDGVAHVSERFSPYAPPVVEEIDAVNAAMARRSEERHTIAERWRVGEPYDDTHVHTVRVLPGRREPDVAATGAVQALPARVVARPAGLEVRSADTGGPGPVRTGAAVGAGAFLATAAVLAVLLRGTALSDMVPAILAGALLAAVPLAVLTASVMHPLALARHGRAVLVAASRPPTIAQVASAVADALRAAGGSPVGAEGVRLEVDATGEYRCALNGVPPEVSQRFAEALDEVVSPMASPRYVLPRYVVSPAGEGLAGFREAVAAARGDVLPSGEVWHSVPSVLGTKAAHARAFADAWDRWVGGGRPLYTGSPEGEGVLVTHRGSDPFDATTVLRLHWR